MVHYGPRYLADFPNPSLAAAFQHGQLNEICSTSLGDRAAHIGTVLAPSPWSTTATSTAYAYGYDGLSLRWVRASSAGASATLPYLYAGGGTPYAGSYAATTSEGATSTVFHLLSTDHGDVVALADVSGEVFARYTYGPFGEIEAVATRATDSGSISATLAAQIASANPIRYAGYAYDTWSGDYYLSARYYDPATKQFISKDPGVADGEESAYQYCGGDPVGQIDRDGARATYTNEGNTSADAAIYAYSRAKRARRAAMLDRARARMRALIRLRAEQRETRRRIEAAARARARAAMRMREKIRAKAERQALARKAKKAEETVSPEPGGTRYGKPTYQVLSFSALNWQHDLIENGHWEQNGDWTVRERLRGNGVGRGVWGAGVVYYSGNGYARPGRGVSLTVVPGIGATVSRDAETKMWSAAPAFGVGIGISATEYRRSSGRGGILW